MLAARGLNYVLLFYAGCADFCVRGAGQVPEGWVKWHGVSIANTSSIATIASMCYPL